MDPLGTLPMELVIASWLGASEGDALGACDGIVLAATVAHMHHHHHGLAQTASSCRKLKLKLKLAGRRPLHAVTNAMDGCH